jgi:hypothetical protein
MLNHDELVDLYRTHRDTRVLSIYLDGGAKDFAERKVWRKHLEHALNDAAAGLESGTPEDQAFQAARRALEGELAEFPNFLPDRGWVGFATADGVIHAGGVRVPMPDLVRWEDGIRVAPYVRALKQERLVVAALVDSRRARIFEYKEGALSEFESLTADTFLGDLSDVNQSKRPSVHTGSRGQTATDAAQVQLEVGAERLFKRLVERLVERMGRDGHLVLGGSLEGVRHVSDHLPNHLRLRSIDQSTLRVEMSDAELRDAVELAASQLNQGLQEQAISDVIDAARSGGKGSLGAEPVEKALREGRVDTLFLSRGFIRANPDYADHLVGAAFEKHAEVEELSVNGGHRLDQEGEGVAARLRFTL